MAATVESTPVELPVTEPEKYVEPVKTAEEPAEAAKTAEESAEPPKAEVEAEAAEGTLESTSFKEESTFVSDLKESDKKALQELKARVEEAIKKNEFTEPPPKPEEPEKKDETAETKEEVKEVKVEDAPEEKEKEKAEASVSEETKTPPATADEPPAAAKIEEPKPAETAAKIEEPKPVEAAATSEVLQPAVAEDASKTEEPKPAEVEGEVKSEEPAAEAAPEEPVIAAAEAEEVFLWGVPLSSSKGDERTDVVLLKFLRARDFKVSEAFAMLKNTVLWRKKFGADAVVEEELGNELDGVAYMHGFDKEGHPVCYNVYGVFQDKEFYQKTFGDDAKRDKFLRWRVQFLEKGIQQLSFSPGGINSMVQITDFKNSPGIVKWELRQTTKQAVALLQDNYPEFVAKKIFINVPWWYLAFNTMISPFLTQRTKSKFVVARPARTTDTLFKYIAPEHVPIQYGGLSRENDTEFSATDGGVSEEIVKAGAKHMIEIPATEVGTTLVWDLVVSGWEVSYGAEFVPSAESAYTVIIQKARKVSPTEEPLRQSYKIGEAGKVVLTVDNTSSKRKKILYRSKLKTA